MENSTSLEPPEPTEPRCFALHGETLFRTLAESAPIMFWITDSVGQTMFANRALLTFLGLTQEQMTTIQWREWMHPDDVDSYRLLCAEAYATRKAYRVEIRAKGVDGRYRWLLVDSHPWTSPDGLYQGFIGTCTDIHDQKLTQQRLAESETLFRTMADASPMFIWTVEPNGRVSYFNQTLRTFAGYDEADVASKGWEPIVHPDDFPWVSERFMACMREQTYFEAEFRIRRADSQIFWLLSAGTPRYTSEGEFLGFVGSALNIQDRKHAIQALQESESLFRTVADASPVTLWMTDIQGNITFINNHWLNLTGTTLEENLGMDRLTSIYTDDQANMLESFLIHFRNRETYSVEYRVRRAEDGQIRWLAETGSPRYSGDGFFQGYTGFCMDITDRRKSEARLNRFLESGIIGVLFWNRQGQIYDANDAFLNMVGYTRDELHNGAIDWKRLTPPEWLYLDDIALAQLAENGVADPFEKQYFHKDGHRVDIALRGALFEDSDQEGVAYILDITERKRAEQERERLTHELKINERAARLYAAKLERSNTELEEFATMASHDLQAPLRKIRVFLDRLCLMNEANFSDEAIQDIRRIQNACAKMQNLIDGLLALSRVTRKGQPFAPVRLASVIEEVIESIRPDIQEAQAHVTVECSLTLDADEVQLSQLFQNLIQNAIKFRRKDVPPQIQIVASEEDGAMARITVQDNGIGIEPEHCERVFAMFQRLHSDAVYPGTGIGLTICKKIVERHGGTITAEGMPGAGTLFSIRLPIWHASQA